MKAIQYFDEAYLERCKNMSATEKMRFLENYRKLHGKRHKPAKSKLISIKIPEDLLENFKTECELQGVKYQTQIKELMQEYLKNS